MVGLPALLNVGMHSSSSSVKGDPKSRSFSSDPTGVPEITWMAQQKDQINAIAIAPDLLDTIFVNLKLI